MPPGSVEDRVNDLLARWEELREQGQSISAESLCSDSPDLVAEVERRIRALIAMDRMVDADATPAYDGATALQQRGQILGHIPGALPSFAVPRGGGPG